MARIRTIKPEFPQSQSMGNVSRDARLLFVSLFTLADDHGRTRAGTRMLASLLYPYDDGQPGHVTTTSGDIEAWLIELEREDCICRYAIGGAEYLEITHWREHQKIDRPSKPKIPGPDEGSRISREGASNIRETLASPREVVALEGKGRDLDREGKGAASHENPREGSRVFAAPSPDAQPRDVVDLLERACSLAGIKPQHAVNFLGIGQAWLGTGMTDEQILAVITDIVDRPTYTHKRTLAYFTQAITDHAAALKAGTTKTTAQITDAEHIARTHEFAEDMVRMFKSDGRWRGAGPAPDQPGCIVDAAILDRHGYQTSNTEAA
jgi:hypothetical protein